MNTEADLRLLSERATDFVQKLTGTRMAFLFLINTPKDMTREWLREQVLQRITLVLTSRREEMREFEGIMTECKARYGAQVDEWIEQNVALIAEIKMGAGDEA